MQGLRKEFEKRTGKCCSGCRELDEDETDIKVITAYISQVFLMSCDVSCDLLLPHVPSYYKY